MTARKPATLKIIQYSLVHRIYILSLVLPPPPLTLGIYEEKSQVPENKNCKNIPGGNWIRAFRILAMQPLDIMLTAWGNGFILLLQKKQLKRGVHGGGGGEQTLAAKS
jgi:hypothetical protein